MSDISVRFAFRDPNRHFTDWAPLLFLPIAAVAARPLLPAWIFMWLLAFAIYVGCKWVAWKRALREGCKPTWMRSAGYFSAWPGMDAAAFLGQKVTRTGAQPSAFRWLSAFIKTLIGAALFWIALRGALCAGWLAMVGIIFFLHFGLFHLLALAWQRAGVAAQPVMHAPLLASSLSEFWSKRWNTAFNVLVHNLAFRPLVRRVGVVWATITVFLISGVIHEAVISFPAGGGYGLPMAYFAFQGLGVLIERSRLGRRAGLGHGLHGWLFVAAFTAGPAYWLFHPPFIHNVILPMLRAFGAN